MIWRQVTISLLYVVVAVVIAFYFPLGAVEVFASISVVGVALIASGILPAMTLLVDTMQGEGLSPKNVRILYKKLHKTLDNLVRVFIRASLFIFFVLTAVVWGYTGVCQDLIQRFFMFFAFFWLLVFMHRSKIAFTAFFGVLYLKRNEALYLSEKENDKSESQAKEDTRLSSDNYGAESNPLHKVGASD